MQVDTCICNWVRFSLGTIVSNNTRLPTLN